METQTRFDLNRAVEDWRSHLRQSAACRVDDLEELESHLRDAVERLVATGLSEEEALLVASRRVGSPQVLEQEFAKINGSAVWLDRLLWMLLGVNAWALVTAASNAFSLLASAFIFTQFTDGPLPLPGGSTAQTALILLINLLMLGVLCSACWLLVRRIGSRLSDRLRRPGWLGWGAVAAALAIFSGSALKLVGSAWVVRTVSSETYGRFVLSGTVAGAILSVLKTIALIWLTALLARQRLRRVAG